MTFKQMNTEDFTTDNYFLAIGMSVNDHTRTSEIYKVMNRITRVVEHETSFLFEAIAYLRFLEDNLQEIAAPFLNNKVETPEVD